LPGHWRRNQALLASYRNENTIESQGKLANVEELLNSIASFKEDREEEYREQMLADDADMSTPLPIVTLDEYLEDITLASTVDMTDDEDAHNRISLMTVHSAKGSGIPIRFRLWNGRQFISFRGHVHNPFRIGGRAQTFSMWP
jgi:DNA helicase-2/ATP-dependent DNA helicase PcrA